MSRRGGKQGKETDRHALLAAAALQDHLARRLRMPGGPVSQPSLQPGAPMTLAQHLGLVPRPPPLLTEDQWTEVHLKSRLRQDSEAECVICREEFQAGAQVLLSCSHTFHRHCLAAFERYSRSRVCPLCRCQQYQKRVIRDGEEIYRTKCAVRIQAWVRGHLARRRYRELRRKHPPKDERLRRRWAAERLEEENSRLLRQLDDEVGDLDALFAELDASVAASRKVCDAALRPLAARLQADLVQREGAAGRARHGQGQGQGQGREEEGGQGRRGEGEKEEQERTGIQGPVLVESATVAPALGRGRAGCSGAAAAAGPGAPGHPEGREGAGGPARPASAAEVDWDAVVARARARGAQECPICLGAIARRGNEGIAWLSCSHCFHLECVTAFEAFELASGGSPTCPVCRAGYKRRCFA